MLVALVVCALLACASWLIEARARSLVASSHAGALAGWAGLSALAALVALFAPDRGPPLVLLLLAAAVLCLVIGIAGAAGLATSTGLAPAAAEAVLVASSLVAILWVVAGSPAAPSGTALAALTLTTIDATAAALIVRLPVTAGEVGRQGRYRRTFAVGLVAVTLLAVADGLTTLRELGLGVPEAVDLLFRVPAFLASAAVPWVRAGSRGPVLRPVWWAATSQATPPPQSCPTRCARGSAAASSSATTSSTSSSIRYAARPPGHAPGE